MNGIGGNVDMNYAYVDYPSIIKKLGKNGYTAQKGSTSQNKTTRTRFDAINKILGETTVKRLQEFLNKNNNAGLKVDGDFYKLTYKAFQAYLNKYM